MYKQYTLNTNEQAEMGTLCTYFVAEARPVTHGTEIVIGSPGLGSWG